MCIDIIIFKDIVSITLSPAIIVTKLQGMLYIDLVVSGSYDIRLGLINNKVCGSLKGPP